MFLVGHKIRTMEGVQGYIDDITENGDVVVKVVSDEIDSKTPPYKRYQVVSEIYSQDTVDDRLLLIQDQRPAIDDLSRFGVVNNVRKLTDGILYCKFEYTSGDIDHDLTGIWLSDSLRTNNNTWENKIPEWEDAFWVKGKYLDQVLDAFHLTKRHGEVIPIALSHDDTAFECVLEVVLPDGSFTRWAASVNGQGDILEVEVDVDGSDMEYATSIADLKSLGIEKAHLISTYNVDGFESIK